MKDNLPPRVPVTKPESDDGGTYYNTLRSGKGEHQFLLDLQSAYGFASKSESLRYCIKFTYTWLPKVSEIKGLNLEGKLAAELEFTEAEAQAEKRREIIRRLNQRLVDINACSHAATKAKLRLTAEKLAKAYFISWPPPESPLIDYDANAKYILDRVQSILELRKTDKISLRDLVANSVGSKDEIMPILERLAENGYIQLEAERRSGPLTVWITVPMWKFEDAEL